MRWGNRVTGVLCALAIVRGHFPGKGLLNAFVDLNNQVLASLTDAERALRRKISA